MKQSIPAGSSIEALKAAKVGTPDAAAWIQAQAAGGAAGLQLIVILPVILMVIFAAIFFYDKARGGYKKEVLEREIVA